MYYSLFNAGFPLFWAKRIFHLSLVSQLEPCGINWIKTKEKVASREKIRKWKTGLREGNPLNIAELEEIYTNILQYCPEIT